jgi:hypothetical protein
VLAGTGDETGGEDVAAALLVDGAAAADEVEAGCDAADEAGAV